MKNKEEEKKNKLKKLNMTREKLMKSIVMKGMWCSDDEIDMNLKQCRNKREQLNVLKDQINARKKIIGQKVLDKSLMAFSHKGEKFTVDKLRMNLIALIEQHIKQQENEYLYTEIPVPEIKSKPETILNRYIHHTWTDTNEDEIWNGKVVTFDTEKKIFEVLDKIFKYGESHWPKILISIESYTYHSILA